MGKHKNHFENSVSAKMFPSMNQALANMTKTTIFYLTVSKLSPQLTILFDFSVFSTIRIKYFALAGPTHPLVLHRLNIARPILELEMYLATLELTVLTYCCIY